MSFRLLDLGRRLLWTLVGGSSNVFEFMYFGWQRYDNR
jgi:hypothetical protein